MRRACRIASLAAAIVALACRSGDQSPDRDGSVQLVLADSAEQVDTLAREPMVAEHPSGMLFVSGYGGTTPHLWRSGDRGRSWALMNLGAAADGAAGNSDVDLAVAPDGTLYFATMVFDRARLEGTRIQVAVSRDTGATWVWHRLSETRFDDRPWIDVSPDGTAHVIWNDGAGVSHSRSTDGGATWVELDRVAALGGSSHLAIGPQGEMAVQVVPLSASGNSFDAGVEAILVSIDGGATWQRRAAPGEREWAPMKDTTVTPPRWGMPPQPRWVEPLAWDADGALYAFWARANGTWLARSRDRGESWTTWQISADSATTYFPYLIARGKGELAASWFVGTGDAMRAAVAYIQVAPDSSAPRVARAPAFIPESFGPPAPPDTIGRRDPAGEYLALGWLRDGGIGLVAPIQHAAAKRMGFAWRRYDIRR